MNKAVYTTDNFESEALTVNAIPPAAKVESCASNRRGSGDFCLCSSDGIDAAVLHQDFTEADSNPIEPRCVSSLNRDDLYAHQMYQAHRNARLAVILAFMALVLWVLFGFGIADLQLELFGVPAWIIMGTIGFWLATMAAVCIAIKHHKFLAD